MKWWGQVFKHHKLLIKLIEKYNLTKIQSIKSQYIKVTSGNVNYFKNSTSNFDFIMKKLIEESKKYRKTSLIQFTLHEFICHVSGSKTLADDMRNVFGYDSEFTKMNCVDSLRSFSEEFKDSRFYVLKEGFSELCEKMSKHSRQQNIQILKKTTNLLNFGVN